MLMQRGAASNSTNGDLVPRCRRQLRHPIPHYHVRYNR